MQRPQATEATPAKEPTSSAELSEVPKKTEYQRFLHIQENTASADEVRQARATGQTMIQERQRKHLEQGASRQQAAMNQMKKASEALDAHRQSNLTMGKAVYEEVSNWRMGAQEKKQEWASDAKATRDRVRSEDRAATSKAERDATKKAKAEATRKEDEAKAKELEELKEMIAREAKQQVLAVKSETSDEAIDNAKRFFYEQRLEQPLDQLRKDLGIVTAPRVGRMRGI